MRGSFSAPLLPHIFGAKESVLPWYYFFEMRIVKRCEEPPCHACRVLLFFCGGGGMGKQKIKRIADFLEKLAVAGIALGLFQNN